MDKNPILVNDENCEIYLTYFIYLLILNRFVANLFVLHKDKLFCTERINNKSRFIHIFCFTVVYGNNQRFWFSLTFFLYIALKKRNIFRCVIHLSQPHIFLVVVC